MSEPIEPATNQPISDEQALLEFLADRDMPCPACGYNLRMLNKPTCPECGLPIKLTVGSNIAFKRAWAIALCLSAMIAGVGMVFILLTIAAGEPPLNEFLDYVWYIGPMAWIPAPIALFFLRRPFCRMPSHFQYAVIAVTLICMVVLGSALVISM